MQPLALLGSPVQHDTTRDERLADPVLRHERQRRRDLQGREPAVLARCVVDELVEVRAARPAASASSKNIGPP